MTVRSQPGRVPAITPYLSVRGAAAAIDFYRRAFDAEELYRLDAGNGLVAGLAIAFIAIIADRLLAAAARAEREKLGLA